MANVDEQEEALLLSDVCKYLAPKSGNALKRTFFARIASRQNLLRDGRFFESNTQSRHNHEGAAFFPSIIFSKALAAPRGSRFASGTLTNAGRSADSAGAIEVCPAWSIES